MARSVGVLSTHRTGPTDGSRSLEEIIFETSSMALRSAGMTAADVDAVVISAADQMDGRVIEAMVTAGSAGGVGKDLTTVASASEHAFIYAYMQILSGAADRVLAVAWSKPSESARPDHADAVMAEPFLLRPIGMNSTLAAALQASVYEAAHGRDETAYAALAERRPVSVARRPVAWPLGVRDVPKITDVACAAVLASSDVVGDRRVAWIRGVGWATDRYDLGDRDLSRLAALEIAAERAYAAAGIADPRTDVDVVEVTEISPAGAFAAYEALKLAAPGRGRDVLASKTPVVNPCGGGLADNPAQGTGFLRLIDAADQVRGAAGERQVQPVPQVAVGAAVHGFAGQGAGVVIFSGVPNGGPR